MFKLLLKIFMFILIAWLILTSLIFSYRKLSQVKCGKVVIIIPEDSPRFIDEEEITGIISKADAHLFEKQMNAINTEKIERDLEKVASIKNAEVYRRITCDHLDFQGKLVVEVEQRIPVFRVMSGDDDYYIDREGVKVPVSRKFAMRTLVVTGSVKEQFAGERLLPLIRFIREDEFWKAQIQQINVEPDGDLELVPLVGDQLIEFGEPEGYREKFRNLRALYEQGFAETGWERYRKISLKYKNQIVCTKK